MADELNDTTIADKPEMQQALSQLQHLASKPEGLSNTGLVHTILSEVGYET